MGEIYEDSYVTIAAALASDDESGFLHDSSERAFFRSKTVDLEDFGIPNGAIHVRNTHDGRSQKSQHVLSTRAWTLQEALLSPRLLTFSVTVFFECRSKIQCECGNGRFADPFYGDPSLFTIVDRSEYAKMMGGDQSSAASKAKYEFWLQAIVTDYSQRSLSKISDKLVALSALSTKYASTLSDTYLAGLWRDNLFIGLSWTSLAESPIELNNGAPSWSWASIGSGVKYTHTDRDLIPPGLSLISVSGDDRNPNANAHRLHLKGKFYLARLVSTGLHIWDARIVPISAQGRDTDPACEVKLDTCIFEDVSYRDNGYPNDNRKADGGLLQGCLHCC